MIFFFRWNYWAAGGLHSTGFHIVNIILHGVVSVLFLHFFTYLLGKNLSAETGVSKAALVSTILFAVHPIHTESVSKILYAGIGGNSL